MNRPGRPPLSKRRKIRRHLFLIVSLVLMAVFHPILEGHFATNYVVGGFFTAVLLSAVFAVANRRWRLMVAIGGAVPALALTWAVAIPALSHAPWDWWLLLTRDVVSALFLALATVAILEHVVKKEPITVDKICAALSVYFLLGVLWAYGYALIDQLVPGSFVVPDTFLGRIETEHRVPMAPMTYYSFVTLATLGYGDITPVSAPARTFSWLEAVVGQLYIALMLARLVGLQISQSSEVRTHSS